MPRRSDHPYVSWRNGRPRFTPSPELRAAGHKGKDLKHDDGTWLTRDEAIVWSRQFYQDHLGFRPVPATKSSPRSLYPIDPNPDRDFHGRGFVYFLWVSDGIKIGFSRSPHGRLVQLLTGLQEYPKMFLWTPGTMRDERRLHRRLANQRLRAEWFKANQFTLDVIAYFQTEQLLSGETSQEQIVASLTPSLEAELWRLSCSAYVSHETL